MSKLITRCIPALLFSFIFVNEASAGQPKNIAHSNISSSKVTISWGTDVDEAGRVNYGPAPSLGDTAYDLRGEPFQGATHYITLTGLDPNTTYYYDIVSGGVLYDNGGRHYTVKTGGALSPRAGSDIVYGQVFLDDGTTTAEGAICYVKLKDSDRLGTSGASQIRSSLVSNAGYWHVELKNVINQTLSSYFDYSESGDSLIIEVIGPNGDVASQVINTLSDSPAPAMVVGPIINVGGSDPDYLTIQEAVNSAHRGNIINIFPDTYTENIALKEGVSLVGVGDEPVIVNGKVTMANNSSIESMTFDYEIPNTAPHVMLNITASDVTVKDCNFRLYQNQPRRGLKTDNLANISGDNITLEGNDFYFESSSSRFMKGIYANQSKNLTMRGNRIRLKGDTAQLSYYLNGVSLVSADNITFENNIIHLESNNAWALNGLMLSACDNALVKNNTIYIKSTRPYVNQFNGISANQVPHINIRNNIINFEGNLENPYYAYYPYAAYLKPCSIIGNTLTGDTNISLTYNIYNIGYAFLSKSPAALAVTDDSNIKGNPQFVDKDSGDFHLTEDSIAIDRGDPNDVYSKEPQPNGGRINCGSYGNTEEATTTPAHIAARVIFASALEGGTITPKGSILVTDGDDQTFTIMPSYYYSILDVLLDDVSEPLTGNTYTLSNITQDHTIVARFTPKPTVTITAQAGTGGYISPQGTVKVVIGDSRTFYIRPYTDYHIKDIMVDGSSIGPKASYTFNNVNTNHTIQAVFEEGRAIIALAGEGGEIDPGGEIRIEPDEYGEYERYTFWIRPDEGYRIKDVLVDGAPAGSVTSYEFTDLSRSHIIEAVFASYGEDAD